MKNVLWNLNLPIELLVEVSIEQQQVNDFKSIPSPSLLSLFLAALNTEWKTLEGQNNEIRHEIKRCYSDLRKYDEKLQILDNMAQLATQSLEAYFQTVGNVLIAIHSNEIFVISEWRICEHLSWNNVELYRMVFKKKRIIGKRFMLCYNSKRRIGEFCRRNEMDLF